MILSEINYQSINIVGPQYINQENWFRGFGRTPLLGESQPPPLEPLGRKPENIPFYELCGGFGRTPLLGESQFLTSNTHGLYIMGG